MRARSFSYPHHWLIFVKAVHFLPQNNGVGADNRRRKIVAPISIQIFTTIQPGAGRNWPRRESSAGSFSSSKNMATSDGSIPFPRANPVSSAFSDLLAMWCTTYFPSLLRMSRFSFPHRCSACYVLAWRVVRPVSGSGVPSKPFRATNRVSPTSEIETILRAYTTS